MTNKQLSDLIKAMKNNKKAQLINSMTNQQLSDLIKSMTNNQKKLIQSTNNSPGTGKKKNKKLNIWIKIGTNTIYENSKHTSLNKGPYKVGSTGHKYKKIKLNVSNQNTLNSIVAKIRQHLNKNTNTRAKISKLNTHMVLYNNGISSSFNKKGVSIAKAGYNTGSSNSMLTKYNHSKNYKPIKVNFISLNNQNLDPCVWNNAYELK